MIAAALGQFQNMQPNGCGLGMFFLEFRLSSWAAGSWALTPSGKLLFPSQLRLKVFILNWLLVGLAELVSDVAFAREMDISLMQGCAGRG